MKEHNFINIINQLTKSPFLGDDCAFIKDRELVVSQDNFIEDIHFKKDWATPFQIGYKAVAVNISDILASGAEPKYLSIGLSLPNIDEAYFTELYKGVLKGANGTTILGGDITGAEKITISITAIGDTRNRKISSRKNAKVGYVVIANGSFGESSKGLNDLQQGLRCTRAIKTHLEPKLDFEFSKKIATQIDVDYAMMDTSDGLADALFQIAKASNVKIVTPYIEGMFGAEDYKLVAVVPKDFLNKIDKYHLIGEVKEFDGVYLQIDNKTYSNYNELGLFDHFNS